ncbi:hypothetical protein BsWGS_27227 [Bradybaena similaris]
MDTFWRCVVNAWITLVLLLSFDPGDASVWDRWWSYEGINGPAFWGRANPDWKLCQFGRLQSPINIEPSRLLYDPNLKMLRIDAAMVAGLLLNTGHDITLEIKSEGLNHLNVTDGPLSYTYRLAEIKFHMATNDSLGSEHRVSGRSFPGEMHIIAYNSDLYRNVTEARRSVKGLVIIAVFIEIGKEVHRQFFVVSRQLKWLRFKGSMRQVGPVPLNEILPKTAEYVTYEGSLTQPGCYESVTWIIMNKPLIVGRDQFTDLRFFFNGKRNLPGLSLEVNSRPLMPLNQRVVRTNINSHKQLSICSMKKDTQYQVNLKYKST